MQLFICHNACAYVCDEAHVHEREKGREREEFMLVKRNAGEMKHGIHPSRKTTADLEACLHA
jgi:hypothetical protein